MKKVILFTIIFSGIIGYSQNQNIGLNYSFGFNPSGDKFTFDGKETGNYSLGWYSTTSSAEARLSGYGGIKLFTDRIPRLIVDRSGYVGIGVATPSNILDIDGKDQNLGITIRENGAFKNGDVRMFNHTGDFAGFLIRPFDVDFNGGNWNWEKDFGYINTTKNWYVETSFAIGTTDPKGYKLAIAGKAIATEIKVKLQACWPDFVFTEEYQLPSLSEVEQHIKKKGHLINIPSAAEVAKDGIYLGEMNARLLEKIEELTLYTIAQEKEIDEQKNFIQRQNKKLIEIESQISKIKELEQQLRTWINSNK